MTRGTCEILWGFTFHKILIIKGPNIQSDAIWCQCQSIRLLLSFAKEFDGPFFEDVWLVEVLTRHATFIKIFVLLLLAVVAGFSLFFMMLIHKGITVFAKEGLYFQVLLVGCFRGGLFHVIISKKFSRLISIFSYLST